MSTRVPHISTGSAASSMAAITRTAASGSALLPACPFFLSSSMAASLSFSFMLDFHSAVA